jgi:hypothetical protein
MSSGGGPSRRGFLLGGRPAPRAWRSGHGNCSTPRRPEPRHTPRATRPGTPPATDGMATDGMATDGMATDGMATDGMATDGMATDGMATDGMATDGMPAAARSW